MEEVSWSTGAVLVRVDDSGSRGDVLKEGPLAEIVRLLLERSPDERLGLAIAVAGELVGGRAVARLADRADYPHGPRAVPPPTRSTDRGTRSNYGRGRKDMGLGREVHFLGQESGVSGRPSASDDPHDDDTATGDGSISC